MKFLGIGPLEFVLMLVVVLLVFKPSDLVEGGRKLGQFLNKLKKSEYWESFRNFRKSINQVGQNILSDNGIEELKQELDIMPDLNKFRNELDQIGFTPNVPQNKDSVKSKQNGGSSDTKISSKEISDKK